MRYTLLFFSLFFTAVMAAQEMPPPSQIPKQRVPSASGAT